MKRTAGFAEVVVGGGDELFGMAVVAGLRLNVPGCLVEVDVCGVCGAKDPLGAALSVPAELCDGSLAIASAAATVGSAGVGSELGP